MTESNGLWIQKKIKIVQISYLDLNLQKKRNLPKFQKLISPSGHNIPIKRKKAMGYGIFISKLNFVSLFPK